MDELRSIVVSQSQRESLTPTTSSRGYLRARGITNVSATSPLAQTATLLGRSRPTNTEHAMPSIPRAGCNGIQLAATRTKQANVANELQQVICRICVEVIRSKKPHPYQPRYRGHPQRPRPRPVLVRTGRRTHNARTERTTHRGVDPVWWTPDSGVTPEEGALRGASVEVPAGVPA